MTKIKKYLAVDDCIIQSDAAIVRGERSGKSGKQPKKTKTKNRLARIISKRGRINGSHQAIYASMYRFQRDGLAKEPTELVKEICDILKVDKKDLIKNIEF